MSEYEPAKALKEDVDKRLFECKQRVFGDIHDMRSDVHHLDVRVSMLEASTASIKDTLSKHEQQRTVMHEEVMTMVNDLRKWFEKHHTDEMEQYRGVAEAISSVNETLKTVAIDTSKNTGFIENLKKKWMMATFVATGVVGTLSVVWWIYKQGFIVIAIGG